MKQPATAAAAAAVELRRQGVAAHYLPSSSWHSLQNNCWVWQVYSASAPVHASETGCCTHARVRVPCTIHRILNEYFWFEPIELNSTNLCGGKRHVQVNATLRQVLSRTQQLFLGTIGLVGRCEPD